MKFKSIISRTPLRISFVGGGTDFPDFFKKYGGEVFSAAINKYMYLFVNRYFDEKKCLLKYSQTELVNKVEKIKHPLIRNCLKLTKSWGLDVNSVSDVASGTGLASSSAFTVGLLNALYSINGQYKSKEFLAKYASHIEINMTGSPIGKQDQYITSYGSVNNFKFLKNDKVICKKFLNKNILSEFQENLILLDTGVSMTNTKILSKFKSNIKNEKYKNENLIEIKKLVGLFHSNLKQKNFKSCGEILNYNWELKKSFSQNISNRYFDEIFINLKKLGAYGAKVLGAGGRGYFLIIADKNTQNKIKKFFYKNNVINIEFDFEGSKIAWKDSL